MASTWRRVDDFDALLGQAVYGAARRSALRHVATCVSLLVDEAVWFATPMALLLVRLLLHVGIFGSKDWGARQASWVFGDAEPGAFVEVFNESVMVTCLSSALKLIFLRERPSYAPQDKCYIVNGDRYSFPSGHTFWAAFVQRRALALLGSGVLSAGCLPVLPGTALVAWSRVAKGRHYPLDTLVGGALGMLTAEVPARWGLLAWAYVKLAVAFFSLAEVLLAVAIPRFRTPGFSTGALLLSIVFALLPWGLVTPLEQHLSYPIAGLLALCSLVQNPRIIMSLSPSNTGLAMRQDKIS